MPPLLDNASSTSDDGEYNFTDSEQEESVHDDLNPPEPEPEPEVTASAKKAVGSAGKASTAGKPRKKRPTKEEKERSSFKSAIDKQEELKRPDWDGIHGRACGLLPPQNQFAFSATVDTQPFPLELEQTYPTKPTKASKDIESVICGLLDDETEPKRYAKSGKKTTVAGTPARIRVNLKDKNLYSITDSGGSNVAISRVKFFSAFNTEAKRISYARDKLVDVRSAEAAAEARYQEEMEQYEKNMKQWQTKLAFWAYDHDFGVFPPELKNRSDLGDKHLPATSTSQPAANPTVPPSVRVNYVCKRCMQIRVEEGNSRDVQMGDVGSSAMDQMQATMEDNEEDSDEVKEEDSDEMKEEDNEE